MINYIVSFSMFAIYLALERRIKDKINETRVYFICVALIGIIGLIAVNISKIFYFENFFILIFVSSLYELWKSRRENIKR